MAPPAVRIENLSKTFRSMNPLKRHSATAVEDMTFDVPAEEITAFLGPNGAGKSTTIKILLDLVVPDAGTVEFNPEDISMAAVLEGARNLYWRLTALENLEYFGTLRGLSRGEALERGRRLLEFFDLADRAGSTVATLSRGMQQKVAISVAMINDPDLLLLDEPTLGLDISSSLLIRSRLRELVEDRGKTVLMTTHQMEVAETVADGVVIVNKGRVVADERVSELKRLFSHHDVELVLQESEWERSRDVMDGFGHTVEDRTGGRLRVVFDLKELAEFYDLMRAMSELELEFDHFSQHEPKLEEIFLEFVEVGREASAQGSP